MIDVDYFHEINSRFGHTTGDYVLLEVATILKSAVRSSDAANRYGGDEFMVVLADAPLANVDMVVGRIQRFVQDWNHREHLEHFKLALSVRASEWTPVKTINGTVDEADQQMYLAKAAGRERRSPTKSDRLSSSLSVDCGER